MAGMNENLDKLKAIFLEAVERHAPDKWGAYLDDACANDRELRHHVEKLLEVHASGGSLLDKGAFAAELTIDQPVTERPGTHIGPYKLLQQIGEGGMGAVYMAEQKVPVERRVALKIIKPGMDTRQVIARFEVERQALALMDHPNIARVFDGGAAESGRPYFVMELVKGIPITQYCDEHHLPPRARLELFLPVCHAVQHAHQKGIIHRDIKPSNILVAEYDQQPVPKVIDFGVAKALHQPLTESTMFTNFGQVVGTLEYMSPEQANVNQLDIDTRSDIYSLGVLLYELLTGTTPFDRQRLRSAAWDEILRIIREEEPPRPSTKLGTIDTLPGIAANRQMEPAKLTGLVRGELDWIVMKALEKDRNRRYEAATALAADIQHYLHYEPVRACPPSAAYRFRKFARRNRIALTTAAIVALAFALGLLGTTWQAIRATRAERVAIAERDEKEQARRAAQAAAEVEAAQRQKAETAEKRASNEAAIARAVSEFLQNDLLGLAGAEAQVGAEIKPDPEVELRTLLDRALAHVDQRFADQPVIRAEVQRTLAGAFLAIGRYPEAVRLREQVREYRTQTLGPEHPHTLIAMNNLAVAYWAAGAYDKAIALHEQALVLLRKIGGAEHPDTISSMNNLAAAYHITGQDDKALPLFEESLELERKISGPEHPRTLGSMNNLAEAYRTTHQYDKALTLHEQTLELMRKIRGPEHPETLVSMNNLALAYQAAGQLDKAIQFFAQTRELMRKVFGPEHPNTIYSTSNLAELYRAQGKYSEAEALHVQALEIERRVLGADHPDTLISMEVLALLYEAQQRYSEAEPLRSAVLEIRRRVLGADRPDTRNALHNLAYLYFTAGAPEKALPVFEELIQRRKATLAANPADAGPLADSLFYQARCLIQLARGSEAEAAARESLALREQAAPDDRSRLVATCVLAECLIGQQKYADAEPLLNEAYEGLKKLATTTPAVANSLARVMECLVQLYDAWGKPAEAAKWRQQLEADKVVQEAGENEAGGRRPEAGEKKE
jgi:eukaryotic-like serine/threonine-protein kinase